MFIPAADVFPTASARNKAWVALINDIKAAESFKELALVKSEHLDTISKLRNEKDLKANWRDFDYIEAIEEALEYQKSLIEKHKEN